MTTETKDRSAAGITLYDQETFDRLNSWYDQQIALSTKISTFSRLQADIAESRAKETLALVQIARMKSLPPDQEQSDNHSAKQQRVDNLLRAEHDS